MKSNTYISTTNNNSKENYFVKQDVYCRNCREENTCVKIAIPYVLRYLTNELAAMNIKLTFGIK
jgi:DNA-directed RNA polymerase beta subunit